MKKKKQKQKIKQRRRKSRFSKLKVTLVVIMCLFVIGLGVYASPFGHKVQNMVTSFSKTCVEKAHFNLEQVVVEGHVRTRLEDVNNRLHLKQGMKIFEVDLEKEKEAVKTLPWIKKVRIERHLPTQILISVVEKKPIAVWQNKKKYWPIDEDGNPILDDKTVLKNLILVVGEDAPKYTPELISLLKDYPEISSMTRSAVRVGNRRWNLYLNDVENGLEIRLPETGIKEALNRLEKFNREGNILDRALSFIDLKLPDRLIVKSKSVTEKVKNGKKN